MTEVDEFNDFAKLLDGLHFNKYQDVFDILKEYKIVLSNKAQVIGETKGIENKDFAWFELEARTWDIFDRLVSFRNSEKPKNFELYQFSSPAVIQDHYFRSSTAAQEDYIVIQWLQDSLEIPNRPADIRGTKWSNTKHILKYGQQNAKDSLISELDLDAPLRQQKSITNEDKNYEHSIYKYAFELIRARKYHEAVQFLKHTGNWSLLLTMKGLTEYSDPEIDGSIIGTSSNEGIVHKVLWRRMCWQLAQSPDLDTYEKGIYGVLSSDINSVLPLSNTWELQLLAYLSFLAAAKSENVLIESGNFDKDVLNIRIPSPSFSSTKEILNALSSSSIDKIRQESEHIYRQYISCVINNDLDPIVNSTAEYVETFNQDSQPSAFENLGRAVRTAVHLVLFFQTIGVKIGDEKCRNFLIQTYIELLRSKGKSDLTPLYVSYLPEEEALDAYSFILAAIEDNDERVAQIKITNRYGLDVPNTIRRVVKRVFEENASQYPQNKHFDFTYEVSQTDVHMCKAAEWFYVKEMWTDCIHSGVSFYRMFLGSGKIQAAREFGSIIPFSNVLKQEDEQSKDSDRVELMEYMRLMECLSMIESWNSHFASKPTEITNTWKRSAIEMVTNTSDLIHDLCKTWMIKVIDSSSDKEAVKEVSRIRTHYISFLLIELLRIFVEAQLADFDFLKQGVNLSVFVASDDYKLYQLLVDSNKLQVFLEGIASASADGVILGEKGIFE